VAVSNVEIRVNANNAVAQLNRLNGVAGTAAGTFSKLRSAAAGLGLGLIAKSAIQSAASFNDLQTRLRLVTSEYGEYDKAQKLVARAAKTFGLSNREAAEGVTNIFTRLRPLGIELADIESSFIGFNTVARLSGVSAAGASAAFTQLAQALGSGRLQGDEFRSIAEQIPGLLGAVSLETDVAIGDLKQFASDGKLTTDILIEALKRVEREGAGKIAAIIKDSDVQRFKNFQNASDALSVSIGQKLLPAVTPLIEGATGLITIFGQLPEPIQTGTIAVIGLAGAAAILGPAITTVNGALAVLTGGTLLKSAITGLAVMGETALATAAGKTALANAITAANVKITATTVSVGLLSAALAAIPIAIALVAFGNLIKRLVEAKTAQERMTKAIKSGNTETIKSAIAMEEEIISIERNKAAKMSFLNINGKLLASQQRLVKLRAALKDAKPPEPEEKDPPQPKLPVFDEDEAERLRLIAEASADRVRSLEQQTLLASALTDEERRQFERQIQIANLMENTRGLSEDQLRAELEATLALHDAEDATIAINKANEQRKKDADELADKIKKQQDAEAQRLVKLAEQYQGIADTIADGVVSALEGAVRGTTSLAEAATNMLNDLSRQLLQLARNMLFFGNPAGTLTAGQGLFGGFLANGGTAMGGRSYIVGERGPELFTPGRTGSVAPNNAIGGSNIVVNVDASGSSVEGDGQQAQQLGRLIGAAVQSEIVRQKMPGGLLA